VPDNTCPECGRPIATEDSDVRNDLGAHCFKRFDPDSKDGSDFEVLCLRVAVARLQASLKLPVMESSYTFANNAIKLQTNRALRAKLAGQALQGILADGSAGGVEHGDTRAELEIARCAVRYADAVLLELEVPQ